MEKLKKMMFYRVWIFWIFFAASFFCAVELSAQSPAAVDVQASVSADTPAVGQNSEPAGTVSTAAEPNVEPVSEPNASSGSTFWVMVRAGGWIGAVIFLLSLLACASVIRSLWTIRRAVMMPSALIAEFGPFVERGRLQSAMESCQRSPSFLASILAGGLKNYEAGWEDIEKGAQETLMAETARLYRRNEFLAVVGNIAPMLGLLGTVLGMVMAFGELASSDGFGRFANLAQGIYFALVTTVDGLLVAIPSLAAYSFFNHRTASISAETATLVDDLFLPLKRHFLNRTGVAGGAVSPPPVASDSRTAPSRRPNGANGQESSK